MSNLAYWYCHHCKEEIDPTNVTFQELHDTCGHTVEWIEGIDLDRLREICAAERDGRLVVLPCKVGELIDKYQELTKPTGDEAETYTTGYRNGHKNGQAELISYLLQIDTGTRAEAEAALKEAQHE